MPGHPAPAGWPGAVFKKNAIGGISVGIEPYYQSADGAVIVYHARYEDVLDDGLVPVGDVALIHDDPPYGVKANTAGRGIGKRAAYTRSGSYKGSPADVVHAPVAGDDRPFYASQLLSLARPTVIWGGHLCQPALPRSTSWLFWDKREDTTADDNGDGELAWTNLGGPVRRFSHLWRGTCRASETGTLHLHGTQKPVALCSWVYQRARLERGDMVFVPHLGSGPDLPAARAAGLRVIGCDVEEWCCATAVARLPEAPERILRQAREYQRALRRALPTSSAQDLGPLFGGGGGAT